MGSMVHWYPPDVPGAGWRRRREKSWYVFQLFRHHQFPTTISNKTPVLRSLVIDDTYWDDVVGRRLLEWGMYQACAKGWTIQTVTSAISASTSSSFREVGFIEVGRLDIFQDAQMHLRWKPPLPREPWKRPLPEGEDSVPCKRIAVSPRPLCAAEANEKQDGELYVCPPVA